MRKQLATSETYKDTNIERIVELQEQVDRIPVLKVLFVCVCVYVRVLL